MSRATIPPPLGRLKTPAIEAKIIRALGGRRAFGAGRIDLLAEIERGLPVRSYVALVEVLGLTPVEEDRLLRVSLRTRVRWIQWRRLGPTVSDRIVRIARILVLAAEVLENKSHAVAWLRKPSDVLNGRTPLQAISNDFEAKKVRNLLYQMEYGVYP